MSSIKSRSPFFSTSLGGAMLSLLLVDVPSPGHAQARVEVRPVETITLSTQQFLIGDKNGKPATLAGELRIPRPGTDRLPAVILLHGSGGISESHERWVQELNSAGVATFLLDSFSGRGINNTIDDQSQLDSLAMMIDAFRALDTLAEHPRIDPNRIAVMASLREPLLQFIPATSGSEKCTDRQMYNSLRISASILHAT